MTDGGDSQLWKWHEDGKTIVSKLGYVLDAAIHGSEEKTKICVWDHHGGVNQQWIMIGEVIQVQKTIETHIILRDNDFFIKRKIEHIEFQ